MNEQYIYQCLTGRREMSAAEAVRIEQESLGAVTRKMVCQGTWQSIWPELVEAQA
jgi:DNA-binding transcriptional regulator YdaS (Cro superfamily)